MALRRYGRTTKIKGGKQYGTANVGYAIRMAVKNGTIPAGKYVTKEKERLDIIAGNVYGNGRLWWVIAAASGVGWSLQVPPGTVLQIPQDINVVASVVG